MDIHSISMVHLIGTSFKQWAYKKRSITNLYATKRILPE
jgi:hypothetical protein